MRQQKIESPLDVLTGRAKSQSAMRRPAGSVGRMQLKVEPRPVGPGQARTADVALTVLTETRPVILDGIVVREVRCGWLALELPPLEDWKDPLRWLTPPQKERIVSAEFYQLLQEQITRGFVEQVSSRT